MRSVFLISAIIALASGKPGTYKETEDFQFSRSNPEGSKSGFYGAQRGNMGGNYERSYNMDGHAQNQLSSAINQVQGELSETSNAPVGSVYTSGSTNGLYGSGHTPANLQGKNFQDGVTYHDHDTQSSLSSSSLTQSSSNHNSGYRRGYGTYNTKKSGFSGHGQYYQGNRDNTDDVYDSTYDRQGEQASSMSQTNNRGFNSHYDQTHSSRQSSQSNYGSNQGRYVSAVPVRVVIRPGSSVNVPISAEAYQSAHGQSSYDHNAINNEAEVLVNSDNQRISGLKPSGTKNYHSSYNYKKAWEKTEEVPGAAPLSIPTPELFPQNSELHEDIGSAARTNVYHSGINTHRESSNYEGLNSALSRSEHQYKSHQAQTSDINSGAYGSLNNDGVQTGINGVNSLPKPYQSSSSYRYHKSWERQGDPYIIKPANVEYDGQTSQRLQSASSSGTKGHHSGHFKTHAGYSQTNTNEDCGCEDDSHVRIARSPEYLASAQQEEQQVQSQISQQTQGKLENFEDFGQQTQGKLENLDDFSQQTQGKLENLEDFGQQTQGKLENLEDFGQQTQGKLERLNNFRQQTQGNLENFGQQNQENLRTYYRPHNQRRQNYDQQQTQNLNDWGNLEQQNQYDLGQTQGNVNLYYNNQNARVNMHGFNQRTENDSRNYYQFQSNTKPIPDTEGSFYHGDETQQTDNLDTFYPYKPNTPNSQEQTENVKPVWEKSDRDVFQNTRNNRNSTVSEYDSFLNTQHHTNNGWKQMSETTNYYNRDKNMSSLQNLWNKIDNLSQQTLNTNSNYNYSNWQKNISYSQTNDEFTTKPSQNNINNAVHTITNPSQTQKPVTDRNTNKPKYTGRGDIESVVDEYPQTQDYSPVYSQNKPKTLEEIETLSLTKETEKKFKDKENDVRVNDSLSVIGINKQWQGQERSQNKINDKLHSSNFNNQGQINLSTEPNTQLLLTSDTHKIDKKMQYNNNQQALDQQFDLQQENLAQLSQTSWDDKEQSENLEQQSNLSDLTQQSNVDSFKLPNENNFYEHKYHASSQNNQFRNAHLENEMVQNAHVEEITTPKPGFWKSVGSKFVSAKDTVSSWFGKSS